MPEESPSQWPPRIPRDSEFIVSKRHALKTLCDTVPSTLDLVAEKDLFILNDHFELCLTIQRDTFRASLGMTIAGNKKCPQKEVPVGTVDVFVRTIVQVRDTLVETVLTKLAEEDGKLDLRVIAERLIGQATAKVTQVLEQQSRWNAIEEGEEKLQEAYRAIMNGKLPQNSE